MGMYTGLRFKGVVKKELRCGFKDIALKGDWELHADIKFKSFGQEFDRAGFIPCGALAYMPDEWEKDYINDQGEREIEFATYYKQVATDGFDRYYNEETGEWVFQCSLKNYESEIENFLLLLPYFIESIEHCEYFYEEDIWSQKYELIDGKVKETSDKFIQYGYEEDEGYRW